MNRSLTTFAEAEARNKLSHFTVQGYDLNGVMHAGTNDGEEIYNYMRFGIQHVLGFEPFKDAYMISLQNVEQWMGELDYKGEVYLSPAALSDFNGTAVLNVTAGDGRGSSLSMPNMDHPEVKEHWTDNAMMVGMQDCQVYTLPFWLDGHTGEVDIRNYDTLVLDTQGNEFEILKGMGAYLQGFKYLCIELSVTPVYYGETVGATVEAWLTENGFTADSPQLDHNDWFFVRSDIKPTSDRQYRGKC